MSSGNTKKEFLRNGAEHVINQHGMDAKEIYWDEIPVNYLCQSFSKVNTQVEFSLSIDK